MLRRSRFKLGALVGSALSVATLICSLCIVAAKVVDPGGEGSEAAFLRDWADSLDTEGIDIVLATASALPVPDRPRLASLKGYAPTRHDWGGFGKQAWSLAFECGLAGSS